MTLQRVSHRQPDDPIERRGDEDKQNDLNQDSTTVDHAHEPTDTRSHLAATFHRPLDELLSWLHRTAIPRGSTRSFMRASIASAYLRLTPRHRGRAAEDLHEPLAISSTRHSGKRSRSSRITVEMILATSKLAVTAELQARMQVGGRSVNGASQHFSF